MLVKAASTANRNLAAERDVGCGNYQKMDSPGGIILGPTSVDSEILELVKSLRFSQALQMQ